MMGVQLDVSVVSWDYTSSSGALTFHHTTLAACVAQESVSDPGQIGIPAPSFGSRAPQAETAAITLEGCGSPEFQCKISRASGVQISLVKFTHKGEGIIYSRVVDAVRMARRTRPWTTRSPSIKGGGGRPGRGARTPSRGAVGRRGRGEPRVRAPAERGPSPSSRGRAARTGVHKPFVGPERASLGPWLRRRSAIAGRRSAVRD